MAQGLAGWVAAALALAAPSAIVAQTPAPAALPTGLPFTFTDVRTVRFAFSLTFLPDGRALVTTVDGRLFLVANGGRTQIEVKGTPAVARGGHAALASVALHPDFANNHVVFLSYAEETGGGESTRGQVLARATLFVDGAFPSLGDLTVVYRAKPFVEGYIQYGGRLAFGPDGHLYMSVGERSQPATAQEPKGALGKVLRFDGNSNPAPDPGLARRGFNPAAWSYGHRNPLGLAFDASGNLWETEMGPKGGDELNLVLPGRNYGWPAASNGDDYNGRPIPDHRPGDGFEAPRAFWNPSISPGSVMVYSGKLRPEWKGSIFIGALSGHSLIRLAATGTSVRKADQWDVKMRVRDVAEAPDGSIWMIEDRTGRILRLEPKG